MFRKILVALDGSANSQMILDKAISLAQQGAGQLKLVSVVSPLSSGYPDPIYLSMDGFNTVMTTDAYDNYLADWKTLETERISWLRSQSALAQNQGIPTEYQKLMGEPGPCICELAAQWNADLILIGRRGLSRLSEFLLGSTSNYVMHHAPCSVLTIQGEGLSGGFSKDLPTKTTVPAAITTPPIPVGLATHPDP